MKRTISMLLLAAVSLTVSSCSVQEETLSKEQSVSALSQKDKDFLSSPEFGKQIGEAVARGLKDLKMDFVTLFRYSNENELKSESERIYGLMLKEMASDIEEVKDARYIVFTADVSKGRCAVTGIHYLNDTKDIALQKSTPDNRNGFTIAYNVPAPVLDYKLIKENIQLSDAQLLSTYLTDKVFDAKTTGSFMIIGSGDKASLYLKS